MALMSLGSFDSLVKDLYPRPGDRIKQWVVDERRQREWIGRTCPTVLIPEHEDNTGCTCYVSYSSQWYTLLHQPECDTCNEAAERSRDREDVAAWLVELAAQPPVESDRTKLSDEIAQPDRRLNPTFKVPRGAK